jgi:hypothetical protein
LLFASRSGPVGALNFTSRLYSSTPGVRYNWPLSPAAKEGNDNEIRIATEKNKKSAMLLFRVSIMTPPCAFTFTHNNPKKYPFMNIMQISV